MKHDIIKSGNYLIVVDGSNIEEGDFFINFTNEILKCFSNKALLSLGGRTLNKTEKYLDNRRCKKIVAHLPLGNSPLLNGVDIIPSDISQLPILK